MKRVIVCKCVGTHEAWYPSPPVCTCTYFGWPPSVPSVAHVLNGWPICQPKNKQQHSNIVFTETQTFEKRIYSLRKNKIKKPNSTMSVMLCTGAIFAKKNSCLVARIVPYYTAGLHLLNFHILESYPSKDIAPGLSHVISH